ncbi:MAG: RagB/SusD family nutrient uptake outer membrane protein [Oceanospirillaceae bacterium]|nr:RagB/SusD family nutrient uptake outer membrane protein [Oceanospirillaceae bacterium]
MTMKQNIFLILVLFSFSLTSCIEEDFLLVENENEISADNFYSNLTDFDNSLNAVYSSLKSLDLFGQAFYVQTLLSLPHTADYWNAQCRNEVTQGDWWVYIAWRGWYRLISRSNDFIDNAEIFINEESNNNTIKEELRIKIGEAKFLRALAYFHLVRLWGEDSYKNDSNSSILAVPLRLHVPQTKEDLDMPRSSVREVYHQIVKDFIEASESLPDNWDSSNISRANKWAAIGYLGKVHLYMEDYESSKSYFNQIINSGEFNLVEYDSLNDIFQGRNEFSEESLFEINYSIDMQQNIWENGLGSGIALTLAPPGRGWSNCTPHAVNIFRFGYNEDETLNNPDPRLYISTYDPEDLVATTEGKFEVAGASEFNYTGHSFKKYVPQDYSVYSTNRNSGINYVLMRYADILLMQAEVLNKLGEDTQSLELLNKVRRRAFKQNININSEFDFEGISGNDLQNQIREERFLELFAEGHRWYDIVRWKIVEEEVMKYNEFNITQGIISFQQRDYYYPIPLQEVDNNSNIDPSTGY